MREVLHDDLLRNLQLEWPVGNLEVDEQRTAWRALQGFQDKEGRRKLGGETVGKGYLAVTLPLGNWMYYIQRYFLYFVDIDMGIWYYIIVLWDNISFKENQL